MYKLNIDRLNRYEILTFFQTLDKDVDRLELEISGQSFKELGIKTLVDLTQIFFFKIEDIIFIDSIYLLCLKKLDANKSFHKQMGSDEKYGVDSEFSKIDKTKEFSFLYYYQEALKFVGIGSKKSILNIGVNKGDEFTVIKELLDEDEFLKKFFFGIDYSQSAIEYAKMEFRDFKNVEFLCADVNKLDNYGIGRFDILMSIGTLQSSNINFNSKFMELYQNHLQKDGAIILGFPNCRWIDSEMVYGAKAPNYSFNEMGLVLKDIHFCKKYLQQKGYRVVITGKDYLFLSARKIKKT